MNCNSLQIICFLIFLLLLPYGLCILLLFATFRKGLSFYLIHKHGKNFRGFIEGKDVLCEISGEKARGIVNVLGFIVLERQSYEAARTASLVLINIKKRLKEVLIDSHQKHPKIFYKRQSAAGYSFWLQESPGNIEKYVRKLDFVTKKEFITEESFRKVLSEIANSKLPDDDTRNWEVLIGSKAINAGGTIKIPVVFRVNHALGDGVALLRIFLEVIADNPNSTESMWTKFNGSKNLNENVYRKVLNLVFLNVRQAVVSIYNFVKIIWLMPYKLMEMGYLKPIDQNSIHPDELTGEKIIYWLNESTAGIPLLKTMQKIRRKYPGTRFNDVVAAVISRGLANYFKNKSPDNLPIEVTALFPERIERDSQKLELTNKFTIIFKNLPIKDSPKQSESSAVNKFRGILEKITAHSKTIQDEYEPNINNVIFAIIPTYLPKPLLVKIFRIGHGTLGISPLPGPEERIKICGYDLHDITFFPPNGGKVGISMALFSYEQKLQMGLMADKAAISSEKDVALIFEGMVREVKHLKKALKL